MKYGIGEKVKIKDYSTLIKEFESDKSGDVYIGNYKFTRDMKVFCCETYPIKNAFIDGEQEVYELDMFEPELWYFTAEMFESNKVEVKRGRPKK